MSSLIFLIFAVLCGIMAVSVWLHVLFPKEINGNHSSVIGLFLQFAFQDMLPFFVFAALVACLIFSLLAFSAAYPSEHDPEFYEDDYDGNDEYENDFEDSDDP